MKKTKAELLDELEKTRKKLARLESVKTQYREIREKLQEQTIEYEKLSALGRLTANVAHEIRNPITVIGGLARRLNKNMPPRTQEKEYAKLIALEAKRLEEILRDALIFSDKGVFNRCECNINDVVDQSLDLYERKCKDYCIDIRRSLGKIPRTFVDRKQVGVAINNLIANSLDAMPEGGKVTVKTEKKTFNRKNYVVVHISDTGMGIPEDTMHLIFEPFFTTKINRHETGLGLPIAKKIVEAHGGFIKVVSKEGKGTTFSLHFPYRTFPRKCQK